MALCHEIAFHTGPHSHRFVLIAVFTLAASAQNTRSISYKWKNVQIVVGGFVDGIIFHPTAPNVRYARTDMGGAYKWNASALHATASETPPWSLRGAHSNSPGYEAASSASRKLLSPTPANR